MHENNLWKNFFSIITNRCLILFLIIAAIFYALLARLFHLQMVLGQGIRDDRYVTSTREVALPASRGNIYDRMGRQLAVNKTAFSIKMDASKVKIDAENLYDLIRLLESKGEKIVDRLPFTKQEPYEFAFGGTGRSVSRWKEDMEFTEEEKSFNASESFEKLREKFNIDPELSDKEARKILNLCNMLFLQRYKSWETITIAYNVKPETLSIIEEETIKYAGFSADVHSLRYYPEGKYFAHIIGYTGRVSNDELETHPDYKDIDLIGKNGIEYAYERQLRGKNGAQFAEVSSSQKILRFLPEVTPAVSGDNVYLTLDRDLQVSSYNILEEMLRGALINELQGKGKIENPITVKQFFSSLLKGVTIDLEKVMLATGDNASVKLKNLVLSQINSPDMENSDIRAQVRSICVTAFNDGQISASEILMIMLEQKIISDSGELYEDLLNGRVSVLTVILDKLASGEITPQMTGLDPCTGSIVVSDVNTGNVLAAVSYPSYNTNEFVNEMNYNYYSSINEDPTMPLNNRAFTERKAPGSTLKMISAITALENGSITPAARISDGIRFTSAGEPFLRCWSAIGHGSINVLHALEGSCNYFFCEAIYRLGNDKAGNKLDSISALNKYIRLFGLSEKTHVEIGETMPTMPTPEKKDSILQAYNPDTPMYDREWHDGDTVQTAIGQGFNEYTAANMNKYILTLATRGQRFQLHLVDSVRGADGQLKENTRPVMEEELLEISNSTWDAVHNGMLLVTEGRNGTGAKIFKDFPIRVAGKTGTAQEIVGRNDHSSFGGFAPYEDPQIAIYVSIPFGDTKAMPALASQIAVKVIKEYFGLDNGPQYPETVNGLIR